MRTCMSTTFPHLHHETDTHDETHNHTHSHDAANGHGHVHENTQAVLNRLSRAIGHLESVRKMVADGRDCSEVLIQIAAVRAAITNIGKVILQDHIQHCIVDAVEHDDEQAPRRAVSGDRQVCEIIKSTAGAVPRSGVPQNQRGCLPKRQPCSYFYGAALRQPRSGLYSAARTPDQTELFANCCP